MQNNQNGENSVEKKYKGRNHYFFFEGEEIIT